MRFRLTAPHVMNSARFGSVYVEAGTEIEATDPDWIAFAPSPYMIALDIEAKVALRDLCDTLRGSHRIGEDNQVMTTQQIDSNGAVGCVVGFGSIQTLPE